MATLIELIETGQEEDVVIKKTKGFREYTVIQFDEDTHCLEVVDSSGNYVSIGFDSLDTYEVVGAPKGGNVKNTTVTTKENVKGKTMSKVTAKETAGTLVGQNKDALILASKIQVGKSLNTKVTKMIAPKLPMMVRGYADSPIATAAMANIVSFAVKQYMPDNAKANAVADLMVQSSAFQVMEGFDIEGMLNELLDGVDIPGFSEEDSTSKE